MKAIRSFLRRQGTIPVVCYLLVIVIGLLLAYAYRVQSLEQERIHNSELKLTYGALEQKAKALEVERSRLAMELQRRGEMIVDRDHRLALQVLRIGNCESINEALYGRDREQRLQVHEFRTQWRECVDAQQRLATKGP